MRASPLPLTPPLSPEGWGALGLATRDGAAHLDRALALEHRAARFAELERAVRLMVHVHEPERDELPEHAAPGRFVEIRADAEHRELVVVELRDALAGLARSTSMRCTAPKRWPVR